jgi:hypothetical protein
MNVNVLASNPPWWWYIVFATVILGLTVVIWIIFKRFRGVGNSRYMDGAFADVSIVRRSPGKLVELADEISRKTGRRDGGVDWQAETQLRRDIIA